VQQDKTTGCNRANINTGSANKATTYKWQDVQLMMMMIMQQSAPKCSQYTKHKQL
jgi:hypothetical protein